MKVRLRPTAEQEQQLWKSVGTARWAYNWALSKQEENYSKGGKFISDGELRKELTKLKNTCEFSWLYEVSNNVSKQAVKDAVESFKRFFKKLSHRPRYKSRKRSKPSFYNDNVKLKVRGNYVLLEKVGWVKSSETIPVTKYSNPRVSFDGKYWCLSIGIGQALENHTLTNEVIGIDVGVKELAVCSNGNVFMNINKTKEVRKTEKRLRRLQRQVSRKYLMNKGCDRFDKTSNIAKAEQRIRLLHRRLANIRLNHIHQSTSAIVKTKPCTIVMENLNIQGIMKNKYLSKAVAQQKLNDFKTKLQYKCEKHGIRFMEADRWYPSSKTCSVCGKIKSDLKLSDRVFKCDCGLKLDRDLNAAVNLAKLAN